MKINLSISALENCRITRIIPLVLALLYGGLYLLEYIQTPAGISPGLDGMEMQSLAQQIVDGEIRDEPFYRAMLYPYLLSLGIQLGFPVRFFSLLINLTAFVGTVVLIQKCSVKLWKSNLAGLFSGSFYALYPVAVYFMGEPFDVTLALFFQFIGFNFILRAEGERLSLSNVFYGCFFFALAAVTRPHFLLFLPIVCFLFFIFGSNGKNVRLIVVAIVGLSIPLLLQGISNYCVGGTFRVLPWQGAYNLYAANSERSNGKYYTQSVVIETKEDWENPARIESEYLFRKNRQVSGDLDIDEMSHYWRRMTFGYIQSHFGDWSKLMFRKLYYCFADYEQYNNKTYIFHKRLSPLLNVNPIGWGILFSLGVLPLVFGRRNQNHSFLIGYMGAICLSLLLFYASARFRLPLAAAMAVFLGGLFCRHIYNRWIWLLAVFGVCICVSYGNFFDADSNESFLSDKIYLANCAHRVAEDEEALYWAAEAMGGGGETNLNVISVFVTASYNLFLLNGIEPDWEYLKELLKRIPNPTGVHLFLNGLCHYKSGDLQAAVNVWRTAVDQGGLAIDLSMSGLILFDDEFHMDDAVGLFQENNSPYLAWAIKRWELKENQAILQVERVDAVLDSEIGKMCERIFDSNPLVR